jgi:tRNA pseudouridine55 synthase
MATGVLVVAVGEATKLVPHLTDAPKVYEARLVLGAETDTLDAFGKIVVEGAIDGELARALAGSIEDLEPRIADAVATELARSSQDPPVYSAIQQGGERAYAKARRGETVVLEPRPVRVHDLRVTAMSPEPPWLELEVKADKGYYVRSLGRDLARALGTVGHLGALRRTESGGFTTKEALPLTAPAATLLAHVIPLATAAARALPRVVLSATGVRDARFGRRVHLEDLEESAPHGTPSAWLDSAGDLVAVGIVDDEGGRVLRGFGPSVTQSPPPQ